MPLSRIIPCVILLWLAVLAPALAQTPSEAPLIGAIRWDNWTSISSHTKVLNGTDRSPFFEVRDESGKSLYLGGEPMTVDAENAYGRSAGIDYSIFGYYVDSGSYGIPRANSENLNKALTTFRIAARSSRDEVCCRYQSDCTAGCYRISARRDRRGVAGDDSDYVRLGDGTAPVFVYTIDRWSQMLGEPREPTHTLEDFIAGIKKRTGVKVKLVTVGGTFRTSEPYIEPQGPFSASTTYAHSPKCCGAESPYAACSADVRDYWQQAASSRVPFIPNVTLGWDWRPIIPFPDQMYHRTTTNPSWCDPASGSEWISLLKDAVQVGSNSAAKAGFNGIVIYAWNELSEGGWLVPTKVEGTRRLEMLATALGGVSKPVPTSLRFPVGSDGYEWPCPPGLRGESKPVTPTESEARVYSGSWVTRDCR